MKRVFLFTLAAALLVTYVLNLALVLPVQAATRSAAVVRADPANDPLACNLSPKANPSGYMSWWQQVSTNPVYQSQFWNDIVPNHTTTCRQDVTDTLWNSAVPDNWVSVANIGNWPWASGGYFTQQMWLHAIPDGWATVPNMGGWNAATGGYYAQYFWLHAVPENVHLIASIGDWPWSTGGYYTQWFWLHAIPDGWAPVGNMGGWNASTGGYYTQWFWLHAVPQNVVTTPAMSGWSWSWGGYYTQWLWLHAVPENWASRPQLPSWPWSTGGYYTQSLWLYMIPDHLANAYYDSTLWVYAAPNQWAPTAGFSVGGASNVGYYYGWLYRFGTGGGVAPRSTAVLNGDANAGYYAYQFQVVHKNDAALAGLTKLAGGYLANANTFKPVNEWYKPDAHAVVIFSFDAEGDDVDNCMVRDTLNRHGVTATFFVMGDSISTIKNCISQFDIQNHTVDHPPSPVDNDIWAVRSYLNTYTTADQMQEVTANNSLLRSAFPNANPIAFRTPWCDSQKSFDGSIIHSLLAAGMTTDSSVAVQLSSANATPVRSWMRNYAVMGNPSPFVIGTEGGKNLVEFPFVFPTDDMAQAYGLDQNAGDPSRTNMNDAVNEWKNIFDQIYAMHGTMVILMHPFVQHDGDDNEGAVDDLLTYMQSKSGTYITNMTDARDKVHTAYGW